MFKKKIKRKISSKRRNPESTPLDDFNKLIEKRSDKSAELMNGDWFVYDKIGDCIFQYAENRKLDAELTKNGILRYLERIEGLVNSIHKEFSKVLDFDK